MKTCPNCRVVHADEYMGTCQDCGAPMGGVQANGGGGLQFSWARQVQQSAQESAQESRMKRGDYSGVKLEQSIVDVAASFVTVDHELLKKLGAEDA